MKTENDRYTSLVIIGNGFDLAHGYKTTYKDYVNKTGHVFL